MSDDDSAADTRSIREFLEGRGGGRAKLPRTLVSVLEDHVLNVLEFTTAQEIIDLGEGALAEIYATMAGEDAEDYVVQLLRRWSKPYAAPPHPSLPNTRSQTNATFDAEKGAVAVKKPAGARATTMAADLIKLGFTSGTQQTAFDVSINNGNVCEEAEVAGEEWGKDPVTTEAGIARRKAKTGDSMPELITAGNGSGVIELLTSLVREYNSRGMTAEASAITTFQTSMLEVYGTDHKAMLEYLRSYRRKYRGRSFPVDLDVALVIKGLKSTDASSVMASMRQENDSLKKQVEALVSSVSNVKSRMDRVENKVNSGLQTPKGKGPPATYKCNICGVAGDHWASKCPQKKEPKDDDKSEE